MSTESDALQRVLADEHAAVYLLGALGAQTSQSRSPELYAAVSAAYATHRARRDHLIATLADQGATPTPAAPAYRAPADLGTPEAVMAAARAVEESAAAAYASLVGSTAGDVRAWAIRALTDAAVRSLGFGATPATLPGIPG